MPGDVITIVISLASVGAVRTDHIRGSVSAECLEKIADIDTSVGGRCVGVWITLGFTVTVGSVSN